MFKTINIKNKDITLELGIDLSYWALPIAVSWIEFSGTHSGSTNKFKTVRFLCFSATLDIWNWNKCNK